MSVAIRPVRSSDAQALEEIRSAAFAPVFASFRAILGDAIYELAQAKSDEGQGDLLRRLIAPGSGWDVFVAAVDGAVVGFLAVQVDAATQVGELGLNAVHPEPHDRA